jgi:hypothetical protein
MTGDTKIIYGADRVAQVVEHLTSKSVKPWIQAPVPQKKKKTIYEIVHGVFFLYVTVSIPQITIVNNHKRCSRPALSTETVKMQLDGHLAHK